MSLSHKKRLFFIVSLMLIFLFAVDVNGIQQLSPCSPELDYDQDGYGEFGWGYPFPVETRVTFDTNIFNDRKYKIDLNGEKIVWLDTGGSLAFEDHGIHIYNMGPDGIAGTVDDIGENGIAYVFNLETNDPPIISGNNIFWINNTVDFDRPTYAILRYNLGTDGSYGTGDDGNSGRPIVVRPSTLYGGSGYKRRWDLSVDGNKMVWQGYSNSSLTNIVMYNLATNIENNITNQPGDKLAPQIYGNNILWGSTTTFDSTFQRLFIYNLGANGAYGGGDDVGPMEIISPGQNSYFISLYQNKLLWSEYFVSDNRAALYFYDLGADSLYSTGDDYGPIEIDNITADSGYPIAAMNGGSIFKLRGQNIIQYPSGADGIFGTGDEGFSSGDRSYSRLITTFPEGANPYYGAAHDFDVEGNKLVVVGGRNYEYTEYSNSHPYNIYFYDLDTTVACSDCDESDPTINPEGVEVCDGIDNNCDGIIDGLVTAGDVCIVCNDSDGDKYNVSGVSCGPLDCNDNNTAISPLATEVQDGVDNDCDDFIDEGFGTCVLQDAYWNTSNVYQGTKVSLTVKANTCDAKSISFEVFEKDVWPNPDDPVAFNPVSAIFSGGTAKTEWLAEYQTDLEEPPEFYFIANLVDEIGGISSLVHQAAPGYSLLNIYQYCDNTTINPGCTGGSVCNPNNGSCGTPDCTTNIECNDGNSCTADSCNQNFCKHDAITSKINNDGCCPSINAYISGDNDCACNSTIVNGDICSQDEACSYNQPPEWLKQSDNCCSVECVPEECISAYDCSGTTWGDCEEGISLREGTCTFNEDPNCVAYQPPLQRVCIEEEFSFFGWINVMLVISLLVVFYVLKKEI